MLLASKAFSASKPNTRYLGSKYRISNGQLYLVIEAHVVSTNYQMCLVKGIVKAKTQKLLLLWLSSLLVLLLTSEPQNFAVLYCSC